MQFTRLPAYDDVLPVDSTHYLAELQKLGYIQCGVHCSVLKPHCAGMLYNGSLKTCILLKSHLNSGLVNWDQPHFGWRLLVNLNACQPGWSPFDGHCYFLNMTSDVHDVASATCQQHGGYLVETDSSEENTWLTKEFHSSGGWIWNGISDKVQNGKYRWTRPDSQVTFTGWRPGEPSGGSGSQCAGFDQTGIWNDMGCNQRYRYICERDF
ncbi:perlucin-like protein [Ostrea edulis]|uniref:perlucin-like protein n=1 Tax=Ostrea edulis TaxID=37623 RepID=UPI0024AFF347|nr:perlucin-like protein [Ostrea edulis]